MKSVLYKFKAEMPSGHSAEDFTVGVKHILWDLTGEFDFESLRD